MQQPNAVAVAELIAAVERLIEVLKEAPGKIEQEEFWRALGRSEFTVELALDKVKREASE